MHGPLLALLAAAALTASSVWVGKFSERGNPPAPWHVVKLPGHRPTAYRVAHVAGRMAVEATVDSSMSLLARPIAADLSATPILCWRWYVEDVVDKANMKIKRGDDYAARVYVAFDIPDSALSGSARFKLKLARNLFGRQMPDAAIVYVWDNRHPVGTARKSSYTDRSQLIVAESGRGKTRSWVAERVDVKRDLENAFPKQPGKLTQIAVAADGDNTGSKGRAAFADIHLVGRDQPCVF